jgi:hypothetical protein
MYSYEIEWLFSQIYKQRSRLKKNKLKFTSFNGGNWVASIERCKFQDEI